MTVADLIDLLSKEDPRLKVYLQDGEWGSLEAKTVEVYTDNVYTDEADFKTPILLLS